MRSKLESGTGFFPAKVRAGSDGADASMDDAADTEGGRGAGGAGASMADDKDEQDDLGKQYWLDRPTGPPHPGLSEEDAERELPYLQMLNGVLPPAIRVIAWCPVESNFNARFACTQRSYRYFFTKGDHDISAMKLACALLVGEHDFRNFCKIDKSKGPNQTYTRKIIDFQVEPVIPEEREGRFSAWSFNIVATAFLWHQVRAMAAVLFAVGRREKPPSFVTFMLDTQRCPVKPAYNIASEEPLLLCDCIFPADIVNFQPPLASHARCDAVMAAMCSSLVCRAALVQAMSSSLSSRSVRLGVSSELGHRPGARRGEGEADKEQSRDVGSGNEGTSGLRIVPFSSIPRAELDSFMPGVGRSKLAASPGTSFVDDADGGVGGGGGGRKRRLDQVEGKDI